MFNIRQKEKEVWTDLTHDGDEHYTGYRRDDSDKIATYLNARHCLGQLEAEKVYGENRVNPGVEQPLVLKVKMQTPRKSQRPRNCLSRLNVLKQMFESLINRTLAYNYKTNIGLITFATPPKVAMGVSHVIENFRRSTSDMTAEGDTALWDALALAKDHLVEYGKKYPDVKKRIVCISDGKDTKSTANTPEDICWRLRQAEIAVDTVSLGNEDNMDLRTVSYLLGCCSLHPASFVNALTMCEIEPMLSLTERPPIAPPPSIPRHRLQFMAYFWNAKSAARYTVVTSDRVTPRKEHPNAHDEFVHLTALVSRRGISSGPPGTRSNLRTSRLMNEMRAIAGRGDRTYDVYVSESDMSFWKVVMEGPDGSPYSNGTFLLYLHAEEGYPAFPPKGRFITKVKHPNVNAHGRICHSIFDRNWTSDTSMTTLLDSVYGLLLQPEHSDPVNTTITLGFQHDQVEFADEVRDHVRKYASKTREWWKKELLGEVLVDDEEEE